MSRKGKFSNQNRDCPKKPTRHPNKKPTSNKHIFTISSRLQTNPKRHNQTPEINTRLPPKPISDECHAGISNTGTECLDGVYEPKIGASGIIHEFVPLGKRLETI